MARFRLMVVEDDPVDRMALRRELRDPDLLVEVLADGAGALERLGSGPTPDLMMVDLNLADLTGDELLRRAAPLPCPAVVWSTSRNVDDVRRCYAAGALGYLVKPEDPRLLRQRIQTVVDYWRAMAFEAP